MLILREVPRRGVRLSAGLAAIETTTALAIAHTAAGGELPAVPALGAVALTSYGAGVLVLRHRTPIRVVVPALVGLQAVLHAWLVVLVGSGHHTHGGSPDAFLGLSWPMVGAHLAAGLAAALAFALRRRAIQVILGWVDAATPQIPHRAHVATPAIAPRLLGRSSSAHPTRGPPPVLCVAA
ncbi:hypothetical protein F0U44_09355 [Nocardioides humilatus]|uniref:Uncharacterized protein n=1 Tax=Nocardioides humilatus TaxID=2607660 RepID=A0A5B1LD76_9ACTN|nr:hypothetical protein [Nocardioides humilatus]KAA1418693.1 hypothetical protein F0U44_09355 [Nocardioides humilatus]